MWGSPRPCRPKPHLLLGSLWKCEVGMLEHWTQHEYIKAAFGLRIGSPGCLGLVSQLSLERIWPLRTAPLLLWLTGSSFGLQEDITRLCLPASSKASGHPWVHLTKHSCRKARQLCGPHGSLSFK
jgi:hypothetical protein